MPPSTLARDLFRALPAPVTTALRRVIFPLRNRGLFTPYTVHAKQMEGVTFDLYIGDRTGRDWYDRPCINNPRWLEMRFIRDRMIQPGDVILEAGGHHGVSAILLADWIGRAGRVVTFEPFPENCDILAKNLALNGLADRVTLERKAAGAEDGVLLVDAASSGVSDHGRAVPVVAFDDYAHLSPTFLKIDVEGFEGDVLDGARQILATRPKLALEVHADLLAQYGRTVDSVLAPLGLEHYDVWVQWADDEAPVPYDGAPIDHRVHLFCLPH